MVAAQQPAKDVPVIIPNEGLPAGAGRGTGGEGRGRGGEKSRILVPNKIFLVFPCSLKVFLRFWCSLFPKLCFVPVFPVLFSFYSHVPRKLIAMFPCPLKPLGENVSRTLHKANQGVIVGGKKILLRVEF